MAQAADLPAAGEATTPAGESISFEELCTKRFQAIREQKPQAEAQYQRARKAFEKANGRIAEEWWSPQVIGGVVLTVPRTSMLKAVVGAQTGTRLHRATDWVTLDFPEVAACVQEAEGLAVRCREILRGTAQQVALVHIFGALVSLLGVVETLIRTPADSETRTDRLDRAVSNFYRGLRGAASYYQRAAARTTQIFYFWGMITGVLVIAVLTTGIAFLVNFLLDRNGIDVSASTFALMITAVAAGGLGACVSAMWRISSGDFKTDYEAGSTHARTIGGFRPFIGAVFGLGLYVALRAGFLPRFQSDASDFYLAAMLAFLGGFSERLAPDVFAKVEKQVVSDVVTDEPGGAVTVTSEVKAGE
jgi:hypothetical protein